MSKTVKEIKAFLETSTTKRTYKENGKTVTKALKDVDWLNWCQALVRWVSWHTGGFRTDYPTAKAAASASGKLNTDPSKAPAGAIHYWSFTKSWHVGIDLEGAGKTILMASPRVKKKWGKNVGTISVTDYNKSIGQGMYEGWAKKNGKNTVNVTAPSVTVPAPVVPELPAEKPAPSIPETPEPLPSTPTEPELPEEKPEMALPNLETPAVNSKSILFTATVRAWIYDIYTVFAITMLFISGGLSAAGLLAPIWVAFIMGGLVAISAWVTSLARSNLEK